MIRITCNPPLPAKPGDEPFSQAIILSDDTRQIGRADWHATVNVAGVSQILDLRIDHDSRRTGHGHRLLTAVIEQARQYHRLHQQNLRRLWIGVGHKEQVIARSFLTKEGFHHIGSAGGILREQDLMIYVRSFD